MHIRKLIKRLDTKRLKNVLHISERDGYVYVSNPKAACSTLKLYLSRCQMKEPNYKPKTLHRRKHLPLDSIDKVTVNELNRVLNGKYYLFSFVRHPLKRAVSAYGDKIAGNRKQKIEILERMGKSAENIKDHISFDQFVRTITFQNPTNLNPHWRPQFFNLYPNILHYDFIGHIETFANDIGFLRTRLKLPQYPMPRKNVKAGKINPDTLLTPSNRFRLAWLYARDFIAFGYRPKGIEWLGVLLHHPLAVKSLKIRQA